MEKGRGGRRFGSHLNGLAYELLHAAEITHVDGDGCRLAAGFLDLSLNSANCRLGRVGIWWERGGFVMGVTGGLGGYDDYICVYGQLFSE